MGLIGKSAPWATDQNKEQENRSKAIPSNGFLRKMPSIFFMLTFNIASLLFLGEFIFRIIDGSSIQHAPNIKEIQNLVNKPSIDLSSGVPDRCLSQRPSTTSVNLGRGVLEF